MPCFVSSTMRYYLFMIMVSEVVCTSDYKTAFSGTDVALLVGAKPRGPGMQRGDLLSQNAAIFKGQGIHGFVCGLLLT